MSKDCGQKWWKDAKFGLFIHWGVYSKLAGSYKGQEVKGIGEWIMKRLEIPVNEYEDVAKNFNPTKFDAAAWVSLAVESGMKYIVITAKHHDGFAMYQSRCSKYNIVDYTSFKKDPMAELAQECKKAGIKLCFYYSQAQDWHDPNGYGYGPVPDEAKNFRRYLDEKCKPQLKELLTQYGEIGLMWFDTPQIMSYEHSLEVKEYVKSIQPNCIVSGRIGNRLGEYMSTGDNRIPNVAYMGDWEVPATLNDTWGFKENDHNWKDPKDIMRLLLKINSRGGNYLLNVGPDGSGIIPQESIDILTKVGSYVKANEKAFYATSPVLGYPYEIDDIYFTTSNFHLYVHSLAEETSINLPLINSKIKKATMLATGMELPFQQTYSKASNQWRIVIELPKGMDKLCTTIDLEMEEKIPIFGSLDDL